MLAGLQHRFEIMSVILNEALFLQEVNKHQAVKQYRSVPVAIRLVLNPLNRERELIAQIAELSIEALGHALNIKRTR